jgi:TetR/AcrR family transcriptional regulator, regulator of biofilm formation and stress response
MASKAILPLRRRFDPDRRLRIARIALDVVAKWGVEGLTHRRVALVARVPLGSITYHFSTLEDLLLAAVELATARNKEFWRNWSENLPAHPDLPNELTSLVVEVFSNKERNRSIVHVELYLAAMRRPALCAACVAWDQVLFEVLVQHTDASTARTLSLMLNALAIDSLVAGMPVSHDECLAIFRRVAGVAKP